MDSIRFDKQIQRFAKRLAPGDSFLREELCSEMHVVIAVMSSEMRSVDCLRQAYIHARKYLEVKK